MRHQLTPLALSILLGIAATPVYAAANNNQDITARTRSLEQQLSQVQHELAALKSDMKVQRHATAKAISHRTTPSLATNMSTERANVAEVDAVDAAEEKRPDETTTPSGPQDLPQAGLQYIPIDFDVPGQSFVSTGPYIGTQLQYSGSNLIINNPNINEDVSLLNLRKNINQRLEALGLKHPEDHSHLLLSGIVEGGAGFRQVGGKRNSSDIDLTSAGIDAYILAPSSWTSGLISLNYDNSVGSQEGSLNNNSRVLNSRLFVSKAFIVIGDFMKSPMYGTIGQMYVPFGTYSSTMISSPLTKLMARVQTRAVLFGFQQQTKNALYGSTYIFRGDSGAGSTSRINNGGINVGYRFKGESYSGDVGGGFIGNIADAQGMQATGSGSNSIPLVFDGFGGINGSGNEKLAHRVPAVDLRGLFSIGNSIDLLAEYIVTTTSFSAHDLTMKSHTARPQALNAEAVYTFEAFAKPTSIAIGYGMTKMAVALGLPAQRYALTLNTSWWRNTLQSLEFRHDINYAESAYSTGSEVVGPTPSGRSDNVLTAQFDIYF